AGACRQRCGFRAPTGYTLIDPSSCDASEAAVEQERLLGCCRFVAARDRVAAHGGDVLKVDSRERECVHPAPVARGSNIVVDFAVRDHEGALLHEQSACAVASRVPAHGR
ncbi:MAG: hypothetical protein ACK55Z_36825, partial [bacterium]